MSRIKILPEQLSNQIAAGEVVERPASVLKELIENSLDAGSTEIILDIEGGGKRLIRIRDNGFGMDQDDLFLCLERHATSKIVSAEDLFRLGTFGFRGEAIPSIASVSRFTVRSQPAGAEGGFEVYAEGGGIKRHGAVGMSPGTMIEVRNLFFNTPARRKFLRTDETEFAHIQDLVARMALAAPDVRFRLTHNGRELLDLSPGVDMERRVADLLGRSLVRELVPVDSELDGFALHGMISSPTTDRSTANHIYTYINGRFVRDKVVRHAVTQGYRTLLMKGRYPVVVLFFTLDPGLVDVNVHPAKHEVRFRDQRMVHDFIAQTIQRSLQASMSLRPSGSDRQVPASLNPAPERPVGARVSAAMQIEIPLNTPDQGGRDIHAPLPAPPPSADPAVEESRTSYEYAIAPYVPPVSDESLQKKGFFGTLRYVGQLAASYLICERDRGLVLVDQHAAHERLRFEWLRGNLFAGDISRQALVVPEMIDFDFATASRVEEQLDDLLRFGFELQPFGGRSFALTAVPVPLAGLDCRQLLHDMAGEMLRYGRGSSITEELEAMLMKIACHGAIRGERNMNPAEVERLLRDLDSVDFNRHCPHGRPVHIELPRNEIIRLFRRTS